LLTFGGFPSTATGATGGPANLGGMEEMNLALMEEVVETLAEVERMTTLVALLGVMVEEYERHTQGCDATHPG
jgi:hypothetical protein